MQPVIFIRPKTRQKVVQIEILESDWSFGVNLMHFYLYQQMNGFCFKRLRANSRALEIDATILPCGFWYFRLDLVNLCHLDFHISLCFARIFLAPFNDFCCALARTMRARPISIWLPLSSPPPFSPIHTISVAFGSISSISTSGRRVELRCAFDWKSLVSQSSLRHYEPILSL